MKHDEFIQIVWDKGNNIRVILRCHEHSFTQVQFYIETKDGPKDLAFSYSAATAIAMAKSNVFPLFPFESHKHKMK